jgi:hypothetical protein
LVRNAVLLLHGTTGSGTDLVTLMSPLFASGEPLDTSMYYVILLDGIGHGRSSKPSDGLRMRFSEYTYDDVVDAQHRLLTDGLGVSHPRLVMGDVDGAPDASRAPGSLPADPDQRADPWAREPLRPRTLARQAVGLPRGASGLPALSRRWGHAVARRFRAPPVEAVVGGPAVS